MNTRSGILQNSEDRSSEVSHHGVANLGNQAVNLVMAVVHGHDLLAHIWKTKAKKVHHLYSSCDLGDNS